MVFFTGLFVLVGDLVQYGLTLTTVTLVLAWAYVCLRYNAFV